MGRRGMRSRSWVSSRRQCAMPGSTRARSMMYLKRAMAGDYDNLLKVSMETVDVSFS